MGEYSRSDSTDIQARMDADFEEYKKILLAGLKKTYGSMIRKQEISREQGESRLLNQTAILSGMDEFSRRKRVLNNFSLWLLGGWMREMIQEEIGLRHEKNKDIKIKIKLAYSPWSCHGDTVKGKFENRRFS